VAGLNVFEIFLVLALALIVLGPERLPEVLQTVAKVMRELRLASNTVMRELTEGLDEPRRTFEETRKTIADSHRAITDPLIAPSTEQTPPENPPDSPNRTA
jgi:sec-independent protein translocase protein TatB